MGIIILVLFCDSIVLWLNRGAAAVTTVVILWSDSQSGVVSPTPYMCIHTPTCVHIRTYVHNNLFSVGVDDLTHRHARVLVVVTSREVTQQGVRTRIDSAIFSIYSNQFCHLFYVLKLILSSFLSIRTDSVIFSIYSN